MVVTRETVIVISLWCEFPFLLALVRIKDYKRRVTNDDYIIGVTSINISYIEQNLSFIESFYFLTKYTINRSINCTSRAS